MEIINQLTAQNVPQPEKIAQLESLVASLSDSASLQSFLTGVLANASSLGLVVTRPVIASYVARITNPDISADEALLEQALTSLQPVIVSFEEQDALIRDRLATLYESQSRPTKAAAVLRGIKTDSGARIISDEYRVAVAVRILRNLLEDLDSDDVDADIANDDDDLAAAERVMLADDIINKTAAVLIRAENVDAASRLHFKLAQARVFEARKRFLEAAAKYYELSHQQDSVEADDRLVCLSAAVSCALLAPAGPARGRLLASLIKDERLADDALAGFERSLLDKLFFDNLLPRAEICKYLAGCKRKIPRAHLISYGAPLQQPNDYERDSVLDKAVTEHNLLAASKLYSTISFSELAELLNLTPDSAEGYAAKMIQERRLRAVIDRVDQIIYFNNIRDDHDRKLLKQWDEEILGVCLQLEDVVGLVQQSYPDLAIAL
ncbi:uncharacterized protein V2V93DRAFT_366505 [Kockiozyma suomiensis]|uniref:uncharacterized protein n=1 Tax=Kockiozyma suomiensis TaxID=1337062 RepID=UPI003343DC9D